MDKINVGIIGATGFTGSELVRLLYHHPDTEIEIITSESRAGEPFSNVHPFIHGLVDKDLKPVSAISQHEIDIAFLALPHGVSMRYVKEFKKYDFPIIDLSGDFRLNTPATYETWYQQEHVYPQGYEGAAYGIPELFLDAIRESRLIANPGCYPTSVLLGVAPLVVSGLIDLSFIIADSKSGVTGAGVKAKPVNHFSTVNDNFKAYGIKTHRHSIEIQEKLEVLSNATVNVQFTPHLLPVDRGILSTIYARPRGDQFNERKLREAYHDFYGGEPFIRLLDQSPSLKNVRGTNLCDIYATYDERTHNIIVISAIDNLVKGAAGQAIQNMNILFNRDQKTGLDQIPFCP